MKTVGKEEMRLLLELIPRYYRHMQQNPGTLLVRFYGVHRLSPLLGRRVRAGGEGGWGLWLGRCGGLLCCMCGPPSASCSAPHDPACPPPSCPASSCLLCLLLRPSLQVRFVVMGNVLPSDLRLHRKYDLKGSTYGRTAGREARAADPHCTLKDLDVDMQVGRRQWVLRGTAWNRNAMP